MSAVQNIWLLYDTPFGTGNDWEIFIEAPSGGSAQLSFDNGGTWVTTSTASTLGSKIGFKYTPPCYGQLSCVPPVSNGSTILARKLGETDSLISTVGMVEENVGTDGYTYAYTAYCTGTNITMNIGAQYASDANNYQLTDTDTAKLRLSIDNVSVPVLTQWKDGDALPSNHWMQVFDTISYPSGSFPLILALSDNTSVVYTWNSSISIGTISNPCTTAQNTTATAVNDTASAGTIGVAQTVNVAANDTECTIGTTTYILEGARVGATVSLSSVSGIATVTPTATSWNFQYAIYCNGVKISSNATVSGTAVSSCVNVTLSSNSLGGSVQVGNSVTGNIVVNGTAPFALGAITGLPTGTTASISGNTIVLTGTTSAVGSFNYSIPITNCSAGTVTVTGSINVTSQPVCPPPSITNISIPNATVGVAYLGSIVVLNATSVSVSGVGNGLTSGTPDVSGTTIIIPISGTPTSTGTLTLLVSATNNCGGGSSTSSVSGVYAGTITIGEAAFCPTPTVTTTLSNTSSIQGNSYAGTILIANATSAAVSNLPLGMFQSYNGSVLTITGTSPSAGTYNFVLNMSNACGGGNTTTIVSNVAGGTLVVNSVTAAEAKNDAITIPVNGGGFFDVKANNGSGVDILCSNNALTTFVLKTTPIHGTISGFSSTSGTALYTPDTDYVGTDSATYGILCNGVELSTAIITFTVVAQGAVGVITGNIAPYCGQEETYTFTQTSGSEISTYSWMVEGGTIKHGSDTSTIWVKWNENTFGNKTISLTVTNPNTYNFNYIVQLICANASDDTAISKNGDGISINVASNDVSCNTGTTKYLLQNIPLNGTITFQNPFVGVFTYIPNKNFYGYDSFTYGIYCNNILIDTAKVSITSVNEDPCWNKSCNPCWTSTTTWKCVNDRKLALYRQTNICYKGEPEKWMDVGACASCSTCH